MDDSIFSQGTDTPHRRKSSRKSWSENSPINPMTDIAREETLLLTHFTKKPTICFGKVKVGKTLHRKLYVTNPHEYDQCVVIEKFPFDMKFTINLNEFIVPGESTLSLNITWTPENEGGCRQMVIFLVDDSYRLQAVLYGTAELPRQKKVAKRGIMSKSVTTPFSVLHTPNLANLKTYNTLTERESVLETTNVRRALPISKSKSNQENRQPGTKKSSLAMAKSPPRPNFPNVNYGKRNQIEEFAISKPKSEDRETKLRSDLKELHHISQTHSSELISCVGYEDRLERHQTDHDVEPIQEPVIIDEYRYAESKLSGQEHLTKISNVKIHDWKALEKSCEIESRDEVTEMQAFDCELRKRQKQNHEQQFAALSPRRETYLVKKNASKQRRSWRKRISSPTVRAAIPKMIEVMPTTNPEELIKSASPIANVFMSAPQFVTSSPIENHLLTNKTFKSEDSIKSSGSVSSQSDCSKLFNSKDGIEARPSVMTDQIGKHKVSPKSEDGMSTDSLNSKNSSASSVEALLTSDVNQFVKSTAMIYDFGNATPSLPEKPHQVQRSTHVVKEPKIVCGQGKLKQKQLFSTGAGSSSNPDVSYIQNLDDTKDLPPPKKTQVKTVSTVRNSVSSRVRAAQKAVRITNKEQLSLSVHEQFPHSQKLEKFTPILTQSARSTVRSVKKMEVTKSKNKSCYSPKKSGVAQSRLVLAKREKTVIPKHPMPFASKNIYYDDRWMQKQEWSFTHWFNFILTPVEDYKLRNCPRVDAGSLVFNCKKDYHLAPSKEVLSFEAYAARRRLNRLRKLACKMFQSAEVVRVVRKVEVEIDSQRLVVRKDRPIHADIGLKQNILNWILSYNPLWLRIGLEMVFGEVLLIESNTDVFGLSRFIITRLVGNPDIAFQFAHPTVPHLYREGYQTALAKHTLKKFLILVYFLDYAKRHRLIEHDPCLFCKDSELKASRDFLLNISRDFLSGEGDVTRHLSYFGYVVGYTQTPLDEFDYAVTNLATDLRDGVRLTRVVEILTGKWGLTKLLRAPAISRLQKIHNLEKVLKALTGHGICLDSDKGKICAKDIVDGHREKTLTLLWRIVTGFQVDILLDVKELEDEIVCLNRSLKRKMAIWKAAGVKSDFELNNRRSSVELTQFENSKHRLLFTWCQSVCSHYGLKIENFTVSFSDGRILCFLIHHYYPGLLPMSEIRQQTTVTYMNEWESQQQQDSDNSFDGFASMMRCSPRTGKPIIYQELLANEAENFKLIALKVSQIGGVPTMLRHLDMSNTIPDEKVVITYVMYLAIRLLEIRHEARAAIVIQLAWRKYQLRKNKRLLKLKSQTPILKYEIVLEETRTPDQSSPLRNKTPTSIKNARIPFAENSGDAHLGCSINDYSPIRPIGMEPLPISSKKSKVLDTILESSTVESCLSYRHVSQEQFGHFSGENEDTTLERRSDNIEAGQNGQELNETVNISANVIVSGVQNSSQTGGMPLDRSCNGASSKRDSANVTNSKEPSLPLNKTVDLKDESFVSKSDLPKSSMELRNETFNSDRSNRSSLLPSDLPNISDHKISVNETFEGETNSVRSDLPVVDCQHVQNQTFEREIHPQRSASNSTLSSCEQGSHNETFDREIHLSNEAGLLNSSPTKVEVLQGNKTFDSEPSRAERQNALPTIDEYEVHENEVLAEVSDFKDCKISNLPEEEIEDSEIDNVESLKENVQEEVSLYTVDGEPGPFPDRRKCLNDGYPFFGCEEKLQLLTLSKTFELDDPSRVCVSQESVITDRLRDHSRQNEIDSESETSKIDISHNEDIRIIDLESDETEFKSKQVDPSQQHEDEDLFNDSYVCQLQNDSVSFSRLNKTVAFDKSFDNGSTSTMIQSLANDGHDRPCPGNLLQDSSTGVDVTILSGSQRQQSILEDEEWTEESVLKMSNARQKEMIVDNENQVQNESVTISQLDESVEDDTSLQDAFTSSMLQSPEDGSHVSNDLDISCSVDSLQDSFNGVDGDSNYDKAILSDSQLQQSVWEAEDPEEFVLKMSHAGQKEMIVDNENQVQNESVTFSLLDKTVEDDKSLNNSSTSVTLQSPEDGSHVRSGLDISCPVNLLQESVTGIDGENNYDKAILSDSQLHRSVFEDEECTEEFVLKMSNARQKEMTVDNENQVGNESVTISQLDKSVEDDTSLQDAFTSSMLQNPEDGSHVRNDLDISCSVDSLQDSFNGVDGDSNSDKAILSDSQLQRSVLDAEDAELTEEFALKMSPARQKEMIDNEGEVQNKSVTFSQLDETVEDNQSLNNCSTSVMIQSPDDDSHVRNGLDIACPVNSLQDSFINVDKENNRDTAILSDSQLLQSVFDAEDEELTEEFVLKMSRAHQKEMIADNEGEVQNESAIFTQLNKTVEGDKSSLQDAFTFAMLQNPGDGSHVRNCLDISCSVDSLEDSFASVGGKSNCDKAILSDSQLQQSVWEAEDPEEFVLKMSHAGQKEMIVENQVQNESVTFFQLDKTVEDDKSLNNSSTSVTLQSSEDGSHVRSGLDISCLVNLSQASFTGIDGEGNSDKAILSDSQLHRSVFEDEEWTEEFVLKMSRARPKEMIADRECLDCSDVMKTYLANKSAEMIQRAFRSHQARKDFLRFQNSAIVIQRWYRCTKEMRKARDNYGSVRAATMLIQSTVRTYQERKRFLQKRKCVLSLQQRRRALVAMRSTRSEYLGKMAAAKVIQRWYRSVAEMKLVREDFGRTRNAIVKIQSLVRKRNCQREFLQKKEAAISIQQWYQSIQLMKKERKNYTSVRKATIQIQALFRRHRQRKQFLLEKESALRIQKTFRMFVDRKRYLDCKNATIRIQQWYRCAKKAKEARRHYRELKTATLVIQSAVRSYLVRKRFLNQKQCLVLLQRRRRCLVLMRIARTEYLAKRVAAKTLQRWYRAVTEMRKTKENFQNTRMAIIKIQSLVRQRNSRKEFLRRKNAVLSIQGWFRAVLLMKKESHRYTSLKIAAIQIQAFFRGHRQRKSYLLKQESALKIQSMFRKFQARKRYLCHRNSAITIQQWYRNAMKTRKARRHFETLRAATLVIQSTVKAYQERRRFLLKKRCVVSLQRRRRALVAMRIARTEYLAKKGACKIIQRWYRAVKVMQKVRDDFETTRNAVMKIQSLVRMRIQRREFLKKKETAIFIKRWYGSVCRMREERKDYMSLREATIQIQALFRGRKQRKRFLLEKESILKIQDWYRGVCRTRQTREKFLGMKVSAIKIQQVYKAYTLMKSERAKYLLTRDSTIRLQSQIRMFLVRRRFLKQKQSAVIIQRWYCSMKLMTKEITVYQSKKVAAVKIQSTFRGYLQRKIYVEKRKQIITVQSVARMRIARHNWLATRRAAVLIQRNYRSKLVRRRLRETITKRHEAAACIQSWFRMKLLWHQKGLLKIDCDCCSSTSLMKTKKFVNIWLERTRQRKLNAVCVLQKYWREWLQRRNHAATRIQSIVRSWLVRRRLAKQTSAAIVIQKYLRGWHAWMTFRKRKAAVLKIQSCLRRYITRKREATHLLQRVFRGWLVRNQIKKWNHSAALIQSFWRGYKVRCTTKRTMTNLRKRLIDVTKKATEDKKLSNRFALGFDHLMKYKEVSEVLQALVNLEAASRLSPVCCAQFADAHAAPVIFTIIRGCNRSVPHMELIKYSVQILLNLAKYAPTTEAVYDSHPDAIDIIFNVLTVFREKGLVFSKSCILLGIIALDMQEKGKIDELLSRPHFKERIMSLYKLTERKYKREESRVSTRARMVAVKDSAVYCEFSNATADISKIGPDWLLGKKILREIEEPLKAMTYLLNCLNLKPETQQTAYRKTRSSK